MTVTETHGLVSSHVWEPIEHPGDRLAGRAADVGEGAQDKRWAKATALIKLPRGRGGDPLPTAVLAHERLAWELGNRLSLSVNEVLLYRLDNPAWGDLQGTWASLHCLVPEPFQRLDELPDGQWQTIWNGQDRDTVANPDEIRDVKLFDHLIMNTDRHGKNVLVSGGKTPGKLWVYFIDHGYAFGGAIHEDQLLTETQGAKLRGFLQQRSQLEPWWTTMSDEERTGFLPFGRRIADLGDKEVRQLVRNLPEEVVSEPAKRYLAGLLRYQINTVRDLID